MKKRGFTLIELIVVMTIISILILLGLPKYKSYIEEARKTKITNDIKVIENAVNIYYMKEGNFPRLSDTSYTKSEIDSFANIVYDLQGSKVELDEGGNYYDIDYTLLSNSTTLPKDEWDFILQNPVGSVYYLDKSTERGKDRIKALNQGVKNVKEEIDVTVPEITVNLSNTLPTYSEVIAQAAVNKGSLNTETHTFTENGRFTFIAKSINGLEAKKTVTVDNILTKLEVQREILDNIELSETLEVPNLDRIHSVTVDNGNINYIANENSITVLVTNPDITESKNNTQKYSKEITETKSNSNNTFSQYLDYTDEEGYTGKLNKNGESVVVSGEYIAEDRKTEVRKIEKQESTVFPSSLNYSESGYTGTLLRVGAYLQDGVKTENKEVTDSKTSNTNTFVNSLSYNSDGYVGELTKNGESRVISGTYTAADTKEVVAQDTANYNKDGYVGTLTQYVYSGTYVPAETKYVTEQSTASYNSGGYIGTLSQYVYSGTYTPSVSMQITNFYEEQISTDGSPIPTTVYYDYNGYKGTLTLVSKVCTHDFYSEKHGWYRSFWDCYYSGTVKTTAVDTRVFKYQGNVTKPAVDTRVYKYKGSVTKPASDTRVWQQDYKGIVTKTTPLYTQVYSGEVVKPEVDTRVWEQNYKGTVYKSGQDDLYKYNIVIEYFKKPVDK